MGDTPYTTTRTATLMSPYRSVMKQLAERWGDKFVEPETTQAQRAYFNSDVRVEVVSPSGYTRRGCITCTTGWQPSLMLMHRRGSHGSWDLLTKNDILVAYITSNTHRRVEVMHDALQVAVYKGRTE